MASPAFRSASTNFSFGTAATSLSVTEPAGAANGDWITARLMIEVGGTSPGTVSPPAGWTPLSSITTGAFVIYRAKILRSGSAPSYNWTWTVGLNGTFKYAELTVAAYSGAVGLNADEVTVDGTPTTATAVDPPSATPLTTDTTALAWYYSWAGVAGTPANASGYTLRAHGSSFDTWLEDKALSTTAAENPGSVNADASDICVGETVILASTSGGGPAAYVLWRRRQLEEPGAQDERRRATAFPNAGSPPPPAQAPLFARRRVEEWQREDTPRRLLVPPTMAPVGPPTPRRRLPEEPLPPDEVRRRPWPWIPLSDPGLAVMYLQVEEVPLFTDDPPRRLRILPSSAAAVYALWRRRVPEEPILQDEFRQRRQLVSAGTSTAPLVFARRRQPEPPMMLDERPRRRSLPSSAAGAEWAAVTITFTW